VAAGGLDAAAASLAALVADGPEIPTGVLVDRMRELVRLRAMVDAALAEQLAGFDRAGARYDGQTSTRAWLAARLGLGGQAGDLLLVARWLGGLPQASKAFAAGEITLEHAAAIARLASQVGAEQLADYEPVLLELARQVPPGKLRVACAHLRQLLDPDTWTPPPGSAAAGSWPPPARLMAWCTCRVCWTPAPATWCWPHWPPRCRCRPSGRSAPSRSGAPTHSPRSVPVGWPPPVRPRPAGHVRRSR
jgi:hypothetical protein